MAVIALTNAEILVGPLRLTTRSNSVDLSAEAEELDVTVFGTSGWREFISGLRETSATIDGFYDSAPVETGATTHDADLFSSLGGGQLAMTVSASDADGSVAYITGVREGSLSLFGEVGDVAEFSADYMGDGPLARGALIHPANITRTAGGTGNFVVLGTVPAGRQLLVAIHVVAISGTTPALTVTVQRDDNAGFASPTNVTVFGPVSAAGSSLLAFVGPITPDDRYRVTWTLTGTTPVARFGVAVGITPA